MSKQLLTILAVVFMATSSFASLNFLPNEQLNLITVTDSNITDVKDFVLGVMIGMGASDRVPSGYDCVTELGTVQPDFMTAVSLIKEATPESMKQGFEMMGSIFANVSHICGKTSHEGKDFFGNVSQAFINETQREQGMKNVQANFFVVAEDLQSGLENFQKHQMFMSGNKFGDILRIFVFGNNKSSSSINFNTVSADSIQSLFQILKNSQLSLVSAFPWKWTNCGVDTDPLTITGAELENMPAKGSNNGITVTGNFKDHAELKEVQIEVKIGGAHLHAETIPNSNVYDQGQAFSYKYNVAIPGFAPSGNYAVAFDVKGMSGERVGCFALTFDL